MKKLLSVLRPSGDDKTAVAALRLTTVVYTVLIAVVLTRLAMMGVFKPLTAIVMFSITLFVLFVTLYDHVLDPFFNGKKTGVVDAKADKPAAEAPKDVFADAPKADAAPVLK